MSGVSPSDMVYRGKPDLIHITDGKRDAAGAQLARVLDSLMRQHATDRDDMQRATQPLCPGCFMVAGFDMLVHLADANGQSRTELARSMIGAFQSLLEQPETGTREDIHVQLDPD